MPILTFDAGAAFTFRVYKSLGDPVNYRWSNAYEVQASQAGTVSQLDALGQKFVAFEQALHSTEITFDAYAIATWQPDSVPYNPLNFKTVPMENTTGQRVLADMVGLELSLFVRRGTAAGRNGKLFYRGCLDESDVEREWTGWTLTDEAAMTAIVNGSLTSSGLSAHVGGSFESLQVVLLGPYIPNTTPVARQVQNFRVGGAVTFDVKRPWYNQPSSPAAKAARTASAARVAR